MIVVLSGHLRWESPVHRSNSDTHADGIGQSVGCCALNGGDSCGSPMKMFLTASLYIQFISLCFNITVVRLQVFKTECPNLQIVFAGDDKEDELLVRFICKPTTKWRQNGNVASTFCLPVRVLHLWWHSANLITRHVQCTTKCLTLAVLTTINPLAPEFPFKF